MSGNKIIKQVSFNSETHATLLRQIRDLEPGTFSAVVREALDAYFGGGVTLTMVYESVQEVKRRLDNGAVVTRPDTANERDGDRLGADILGAFD